MIAQKTQIVDEFFEEWQFGTFEQNVDRNAQKKGRFGNLPD